MSQQLATFKEWIGTVREDVETVKRIVDNGDADEEARRLAATALNYLVKKMDLIPDWQESIGVLDDVFVLRTLLNLASQHGLDSALDTKTSVELGRLVNEAHVVEKWLGGELFGKFSRYCMKLPNESVRGRSANSLVTDAGARSQLYIELDSELRKIQTVDFSDAEKIEVEFKAYLSHKLSN